MTNLHRAKPTATVALTILGAAGWLIGLIEHPARSGSNEGGRLHPSRFVLRRPDASQAPTITGFALTNAIKEIDEGFANLEKGQAVFNVPKSMTVDDTYRIVARVALNGQDQNILRNLRPELTTKWREAHITPSMKAQVTGADFRIQPVATEAQLIGGGEYTEWAWLVTPEKSGEKELTLTLTAVLSISGFEKPRDVVVTTQRVHVTISAKNVALRFVLSHWDQGVAAIVGALALAAGQRLWPKLRRNRRRRSAGL